VELCPQSAKITVAYEPNVILPARIPGTADFGSRRRNFRMNSSILLVGAVFACLAFGVLLAYAVCYAMFNLFRAHAQSTARRSQTASVSISTGN
jgi:hypothetical protein